MVRLIGRISRMGPAGWLSFVPHLVHRNDRPGFVIAACSLAARFERPNYVRHVLYCTTYHPHIHVNKFYCRNL